MGIEIVKITDYDYILEYLLQQYKDKPHFKAILQAFNTQGEDLETAIFEIRDNYWLNTANGDQLDVLGSIQNEPRLGKTDTNYRTSILARVGVNNGSGEFETIISMLTNFFGATYVQLQNTGNANLFMWTDATLTTSDFDLIQNALAAGVQLYIIHGSTNPFVMYGDTDGLGFDKINDDEPLLDVNGDTVQDANGDNIQVTINESDGGSGGELQNVWL
jgi:hypothetical protein